MRPHWDGKAEGWNHHLPRTELFSELLETVMTAASPSRDDVGVDLGAGTGFLTIPLAERAKRVYAIDHSSAMIDRLRRALDDRGLRAFVTQADMRRFAPPEPVDVVVSNYALHHLRGPAKVALIASCHRWLSPGGRIAVGDLMVPLTLRPGQSGPLRAKVRDIARKGLPGYVRIARNAARWALGRGEYPASSELWEEMLRAAGFVDVASARIGEESGVVWGRKPVRSADGPERPA